MRNVTYPAASRYEKNRPPANTAANVFPNSERNHPLGAPCFTSLPKNKVDHNGGIVLGDLGNDAADSERSHVLAILRAAYRVARSKRQRIQTDLDLLIGIARAAEKGIYEPAFAIERAVAHGLVASLDFEVEL
jgi:hypothetical protein